jgi:hypothetical protein
MSDKKASAPATPPAKKRRVMKKASTTKKVEGVFVEGGQKHSPEVPQFNLAGRPDQLNRGIKRTTVEVAEPYHMSNINTESYWHFVIRSSKEEWIRFNTDSISAVLYGTYTNPNHIDGSPIAALAATTVALRAGVNAPFMFLDPSVMGTSFCYRVDVAINNQNVPTNSCVGDLLLHYCRCANVFNGRAKNFFSLNTDIKTPTGDDRKGLTSAMRLATSAFDYITPLSSVGSRIVFHLDGIFPFDAQNKTIESIDRKPEKNLVFPPDTEIEIKLHVYRNKSEAIFHNTFETAPYFSNTTRELPRPTGDVKIAFQSVVLEYESTVLEESEHVKSIKRFMDGGKAIYNYDIIRGQHQALEPDQSTSQNTFYIQPHARLLYIMYLPDWATFVQETTRKPLSGWSRFPEGATKITASFASTSYLVTKCFENFGINDSNSEITKKIYYEYLRSNRMINCSFEELFPRAEGTYSINQCFVFDVHKQRSEKIEKLTLMHEFAANSSPKKIQVVCISVHPNGEAICRMEGGSFKYVWDFQINA